MDLCNYSKFFMNSFMAMGNHRSLSDILYILFPLHINVNMSRRFEKNRFLILKITFGKFIAWEKYNLQNGNATYFCINGILNLTYKRKSKGNNRIHHF